MQVYTLVFRLASGDMLNVIMMVELLTGRRPFMMCKNIWRSTWNNLCSQDNDILCRLCMHLQINRVNSSIVVSRCDTNIVVNGIPSVVHKKKPVAVSARRPT